MREPTHSPGVAVLVWGDAVEDFLAPLGIGVRQFATEMDGGWLFGYAEALRRAGVRPVVVCVSREVRRAERLVHEATGAAVWVLPLPRRYRPFRAALRDPYATDLWSAFSPNTRLPRPLRRLIRDVAPYLPLPLLALARVLRRERIEALVVQEYESARFDLSVGVGRAVGVPVFASFQGGTWHVSRIEGAVRTASLRAAAGVIVASADEAERVRERYGVPDAKIARIVNPLDFEAWAHPDRDAARSALGVPAAAEVAAWHGRVDLHRKGLDVLLDAWGRVIEARPSRDLQLRLVGTGPSAGELRARIADGPAGVSWRDEYVLDRSELYQHLASADVYVLPSRHEGFPVALVEALAAGLPAVAADAPGVRDVFGTPPAGLVVPTEDAQALADGLGRLLDDQDLRSRLGRDARRRGEAAFGLDAVGEALRRFLLPGEAERDRMGA